MQDAMNSAVQGIITRMFFSPIHPPDLSQFLDIHVSRDNIVEDTIRELSEHQTSDLKKPLRVCFPYICVSIFSKFVFIYTGFYLFFESRFIFWVKKQKTLVVLEKNFSC